ncbi:hypothetical protein [Mucilaginibacter sp. L3T2-6]|uniref:hypothetical protein n=1 Tax=Mucilaginibacter sp. L3T2-6 TaxID=3062491 RepID=UPI0026766B6D|nr:hypothetical protein [Mucilaginibacter sp. L3T2-6]MDO3643853.1 hypothetical protein [Mucilaginibacter sp. L3T2-6]MDV6216424.1 hypothetical protein [Mucilaginibacter sp. L3T2-6]
MNATDTSIVGSPNIFLRKNFERGHVFRGLYFIIESFRQQFEDYSPVPHFKVRITFYREIVDALNDLTRIAASEDESCEMFVGSMYENLGLQGFEHAADLSLRIVPIFQFGASVVYISSQDVTSLKNYVRAYIKLFHWYPTYYSSDRYARFVNFLSTIKEWERLMDSRLSRA